MHQPKLRWPGGFGWWAMNAISSANVMIVLSLCLAMSSMSNGQTDPRALRPVDQGVGDTGPLSANRRVVPLDMRVPSGFDRVYKFGEGSSSKFARRSGGLTAVFPRSTYIGSASGTVAVIPPGTMFYVGKLPDSLFGGGVGGLGSRPIPKPLMLADTSAIDLARAPANRPVESRQENRAVTPSSKVRESNTVFSVFDDERFRTRRIDGLLDRAFRAVADLPGISQPERAELPAEVSKPRTDSLPAGEHSEPKNP